MENGGRRRADIKRDKKRRENSGISFSLGKVFSLAALWTKKTPQTQPATQVLVGVEHNFHNNILCKVGRCACPCT